MWIDYGLKLSIGDDDLLYYILFIKCKKKFMFNNKIKNKRKY